MVYLIGLQNNILKMALLFAKKITSYRLTVKLRQYMYHSIPPPIVLRFDKSKAIYYTILKMTGHLVRQH